MSRMVPVVHGLLWRLGGALCCSVACVGAGCGDDGPGRNDAGFDASSAGTTSPQSGSQAPAGGGGGAGGTVSGGGSGGSGQSAIDSGVRPADAGASVDDDAGSDAPDAQRDAAQDAGSVDPGDEGDGEHDVGPNYTTSADLTDRGAPKGRSFNFTMASADSAIFKGDDATLNADQRHPFSRRIDVYVPARYVDGDAAPVLIIQDGPGQLGLIKNALDNLTVASDPARKLPAFIAIAVANGGSDSKGSERGLEYDTMSDRYARFIHDEVLPAVRARPAIAQAYPKLAFTDDPDGRATLGCSSGGAAAFTMGWFRPDWFRRVIAYSTTLVDQQDDDAAEEQMYPLGAWEYHSGKKLIANTPRKPLRIFLHVADRDLGWDAPESGHHNWVLANQRTAAALAAQGYHYRFVTAANAGHCDGKVFNQTLADTLLWVWRGYPTE